MTRTIVRQEASLHTLTDILTLTELAFGEEGPVVARLVAALQASDSYTGLSFVAEEDGELIGHAMATRSWIDAPEALVEVLVLSPLSVLPASRRRGVGRALVAEVLQAADADQAPAVFVEGDPDYYAGLGFQPAARHGVTPPSVRIPGPACQVVTLGAYRDWMRGALVYNDRFWALDCVGLR